MPPTDPLEQALSAMAEVAASFFAAWHRVLSTGYRFVRASALWIWERSARWAAQWEDIVRYLAAPARSHDASADAGAPLAAAFGARAFVFGILMSGAIATAAGDTARAAIATLLVEVAWAAGRLAICVALIPGRTMPRRRLFLAYLTGLAPYALGLTALLRAAALLASALLTGRELRAAGLGGRDTRTALAWAFGGQAAVIALGFAVRGGLAMLTGT
jgi:hypothetical protein